MKNILTAAMLLAVLASSSAFACNTPKPKPNCTCVGNQWVENTTVNNNVTNHTTNNVDNSVKSNSSAVSNSTATGGNASASVASGAVQNTVAGGSVSNSGNSSQSQNQSQTVSNSGNATIAAGAVQNSTSATATNNGNNSNNANNSSTNNASGNSTEVTVQGDSTVYQAARIPVSTAYAASLTSGMDTCLGSASGGVQLPLLGVSLGKTTLDKGCKLIKETHLLREAGYENAACYRMRSGKEGKEIDAALKAAGITCQPVVVTPVVVTKEVPGPTITVIKEVAVKTKGQ